MGTGDCRDGLPISWPLRPNFRRHITNLPGEADSGVSPITSGRFTRDTSLIMRIYLPFSKRLWFAPWRRKKFECLADRVALLRQWRTPMRCGQEFASFGQDLSDRDWIERVTFSSIQ